MYCAGRIFEDDTVVRGFDVAVSDPDIFTMIGINAVAVGKTKVVQNTDAVDQNIVASDLHRPHRPQ